MKGLPVATLSATCALSAFLPMHRILAVHMHVGAGAQGTLQRDLQVVNFSKSSRDLHFCELRLFAGLNLYTRLDLFGTRLVAGG